VLLLAPGVTLLLVLANRAILKAPQAGEQHIHQVVLKPVKLVRDEGDDVQIPVGVIPARELEDLRAEDALGVVPNPSRHECEGLKGWAQLIVKATNQAQIDHPLFDLGGFG